MRSRHCAILGILFGVFALSALANIVSTATATADCSGYSLTVNLSELSVGTMYTVDYSFLLTCGGSTTTVSGTIGPFTATSTTSTQTAAQPWPTTPLTTSCSVTGTATLNGSTVNITFNGSTSVTLTCGGTACPATIGFWKHHAFPNSVQTSGLTIGGVNYSAAELLTILNSNGGNAVTILGRQLVGALLNLAASGKHNPAADAAITSAEALLQTNSLNLLTSFVSPSTSLGQALLVQAAILDAYNNADFNTCSDGSGLMVGST
jgi:hypothetical protein